MSPMTICSEKRLRRRFAGSVYSSFRGPRKQIKCRHARPSSFCLPRPTQTSLRSLWQFFRNPTSRHARQASRPLPPNPALVVLSWQIEIPFYVERGERAGGGVMFVLSLPLLGWLSLCCTVSMHPAPGGGGGGGHRIDYNVQHCPGKKSLECHSRIQPGVVSSVFPNFRKRL